MAAILILFLIAISGKVGQTAYQIVRPVAQADEPINQSRLYGEDADVHKGIDWSNADIGDTVYAVADGEVVDRQAGRPNNCHPWEAPPLNCPAWGNFVLIQHDDRHYDKDSGQWAYVYSLYLHLQHNQVYVNEGAPVNQGAPIAQADNTGNSEGDHLHLQIVVHPDPNREIEPVNTLQSETRSRNPELWIDRYPANTSTAVGRLSNTYGDPVGNKLIVGFEKPVAAGGREVCLLTYSDPDLNGDDILVENFGTADIDPGTYHLRVYTDFDIDTCTGNTLYEDLGEYTFEAGRTTYIGLDPVYLPDVKEGTGWDSSIHIRNAQDFKDVKVNVTYFQNSGKVKAQQTHHIGPHSTHFVNPPSGRTAAAIVSSGDVHVSMLTMHNSPFASTAHVGVETPDTRAYIPLVHRNNYSYYGDWNSNYDLQSKYSRSGCHDTLQPKP